MESSSLLELELSSLESKAELEQVERIQKLKKSIYYHAELLNKEYRLTARLMGKTPPLIIPVRSDPDPALRKKPHIKDLAELFRPQKGKPITNLLDITLVPDVFIKPPKRNITSLEEIASFSFKNIRINLPTLDDIEKELSQKISQILFLLTQLQTANRRKIAELNDTKQI